MKNLLDSIGFKYNDEIFDNTKYINKIVPFEDLPKEKPPNNKHASYRTWQINQPFVFNNDISKIDLTEKQKEEIINNSYIIDVYPDIKFFENI